MVSFQCDACTDVVKKPKLDNHYGQCRSSFTCIDCSSTFTGPVDWKGHTSCITEAEKYQKSVYKGPKKGQGSRPGNGHQSHNQLKTMNATGKYHRSNSSQSSWSRPQYIRNCASGANNTPLGSPRRMSPVDTSAVKPSPSVANTATKTECGDVKNRDAEKHTPNGTEPKEKKRKKHDAPREHDGKDTPPPRDETNHVASKVKGSSEGHRRSETNGDNTQSKTQFATEGIPETSGDKKVKKRKKEEKAEKARLKQGDVSKETNTPPEPVAPSVDDGTKDEKKVKKRKHKEKKEEDTETNHGSLARETATRLEPLASQTGDDKGEKKKKKGKEEKAAGKKRKHEDSVANDVTKKRKQREQE